MAVNVGDVGWTIGTPSETKSKNNRRQRRQREPRLKWLAGKIKTGRLVAFLKGLARTKWRGHNLVIWDAKQEITEQVVPLLKKLGYTVIVIDSDGSYVHGDEEQPSLNVFEPAISAYHSTDRRLYSRTTSMLGGIVEVMVPPAEKNDSSQFFSQGGHDLLMAIVIYLIVVMPELATPGRLYRILADPIETKKCLNDLLALPSLHREHDPVLEDGKRLVRSVLSAAEEKPEYFNGFLRNAISNIHCFDESGPLSMMGERPTHRFADIRTKKRMAIICRTPLDQLHRQKVFAALVTMAVLQTILLHRGYRVHLVLEEAPALKLPRLESYLNTIRGPGGSCEIYTQSRAAMKANYSELAVEQMVANSEVQMYATPNSLAEARELSQLLGNKIKVEVKGSIDKTRFEQIGLNIGEKEVPRFTPQQIMALGRDKWILKVSGLSPFIIGKVAQWEIAGLREHLGDNPVEGPQPKAKARLKLKITRNGTHLVWPRIPRNAKGKAGKKRRTPLFTWKSLIWAYAWAALIVGYQVNTTYSFDLPAVRYQYTYRGSSSAPFYTSCDYLRLNGDRLRSFGPSCPFIVMMTGRRS